MKCRNRLWQRLAVLPVLLCVFCLFCGAPSMGRGVQRQVIRVGYPIQQGMTDINEKGDPFGYTCDYLEEVAQYTGWEYEFIRVDGDLDTQLTVLMEMLERGDIDLMGGMVLDDALTKKYDYASNSYGVSSRVLGTLAENGELSSTSYFTHPNLRVAVIEGAEQSNGKLEQFCEMSGFSVIQVPCTTEMEQLNALRAGKADLFYGIDINLPSSTGLKIVASFMPRPFYFATTKGNKAVVTKLNSAIDQINEINPYFTTTLHERYFATGTYQFALSKAEIDYIDQAGTLRVAMLGGKAPIQYRDPTTREIRGVSKDLLEHVSQQTGLQFECVMADTYEEYQRLLDNREVQMVAGIFNDHKLTDNRNLAISLSYLRAPLTIVIHNSVDPTQLQGKRLALPAGTNYEGGYQGVMTHYDTPEQCVAAVHKGIMDYCYMNGYSGQYYLSNPAYRNMITISQPDEWSQDFCLGVMNNVDMSLLSILNKSIRSLPQMEFTQASLYANIYESGDVTLLSYVRSNPTQAVMVLVMLVMFFTIVLLLWTRYTDRKNSQLRQLENARYEQISELSNEFLYEYDVTHDRLSMPEKCAGFLGCPRVVEQLTRRVGQAPEDDVFRRILSQPEGSHEICCLLPRGDRRWLRVLSKRILDSAGAPIYFVGKLMDIQNEREQQEELLEKARRDGLTGLYNAATTRQLVEERLENGTDHGALIVLDVDRFKNINDTYGHYAGDQVLQCLAKTLREALSGEIIGRTGGDEFVAYLREGGTPGQMRDRCDDLCRRIAAMDTGWTNVKVSIGCAFAAPQQTYDALFCNADLALYHVKKRGRNGYYIYEEGMEE